MLDEQRRHGRIVGLILDLSNHDCLYTEDLEADGTVQVKMEEYFILFYEI